MGFIGHTIQTPLQRIVAHTAVVMITASTDTLSTHNAKQARRTSSKEHSARNFMQRHTCSHLAYGRNHLRKHLDCTVCNPACIHAQCMQALRLLPQMAEVWMIIGELVQACCVRMAFIGKPEDRRPNCCPAVLGGMNTFSGLMPIMWSSKSAADWSVGGVGVGC